VGKVALEKGTSVSTLMQAARFLVDPAMATGQKSLRITLAEGLAFLTSAMS
jgi:hypothetical protein